MNNSTFEETLYFIVMIFITSLYLAVYVHWIPATGIVVGFVTADISRMIALRD